VTSPVDSNDASPAEIVKHTKEWGFRAIAITDHDSVDGVKEAINVGKEISMNVIPGVELYCYYEDIETEIVGLGIDYIKMAKLLVPNVKTAIERNKENISKLFEIAQENGFIIEDESLDDVTERTNPSYFVVQRTFSIEENRKRCEKLTGVYPKNEKQFYDELFVIEKLIRDPFWSRPISKAIEMVHESGGKAFLAHPKRIKRRSYEMGEKEYDNLIEDGLDGIECVHAEITPKDSTILIDYCDSRNILKSGGSDSHRLVDIFKRMDRLNAPNEWIDWYKLSY
jgi:hypothetical protein